jgi:hypothetical protein
MAGCRPGRKNRQRPRAHGTGQRGERILGKKPTSSPSPAIIFQRLLVVLWLAQPSKSFLFHFVLFFCLSVYLSIYLFVCLSFFVFICLSV